MNHPPVSPYRWGTRVNLFGGYVAVVSKLQSKQPYRSQNYGNWVRLRHLDDHEDADARDALWVPCATRYEPETKNIGGSLGSYRDIPSDAAIEAAVKTFLRASLRLSATPSPVGDTSGVD